MGTKIETIDSRTVHTGGSPYNEKIEGNFISRDLVNKNVKNIRIGNREVEINPNDIVETFDEFRDILARSIAQSSNALEAISKFAKELTEELRNRPELKVCFDVNENISEQELVKKIFINLLTQVYDQISKTNQSDLIVQPDLIQKINISKGSVFIEHFEVDENNQHNFMYKGYTVNLSYKSSKGWRYIIKRSDSSIKQSKTLYSLNVYFAIARAVSQIDEEMDANLENSYEY